jgi:hypothetical protein
MKGKLTPEKYGKLVALRISFCITMPSKPNTAFDTPSVAIAPQ